MKNNIIISILVASVTLAAYAQMVKQPDMKSSECITACQNKGQRAETNCRDSGHNKAPWNLNCAAVGAAAEQACYDTDPLCKNE